MEKPGNKLTEIPLAASRPADLHGGRDRRNAAVPSLDYSKVTDVNPSVVLIAPNDGHLRNMRRALQERRATILREFSIYPGYAHLSALLEADCDAFVVEIDSDMEAAMDLVEAICA